MQTDHKQKPEHFWKIYLRPLPVTPSCVQILIPMQMPVYRDKSLYKCTLIIGHEICSVHVEPPDGAS